MMKAVKTCLGVAVGIVMFPIFVAFFLIFMVMWMVSTLSGIGPFLQYICNRIDKKTLDRNRLARESKNGCMRVLSVPAGVHGSAPDGYKVFTIYMEPETASTFPPVCIPNGLGATAVLVSQMQEELVAHGFRVLSFDRLGVGLSDPNSKNRFASAPDVVREMDYVMEAVLPDEKWILLGPSMGSIVAQCYTAMHPNKVIGILNMDGLPYPFIKFYSSFMWAGFIYRIYASIVWTGVLRPFIGTALRGMQDMFKCQNFPLDVAIAQMNQTQFFGNVALEMATMMDCCRLAEQAWGPLSVLRLPAEHLHILITAPPSLSIDFVRNDQGAVERQATTARSPSELGDAWADSETVQRTVAFLHSNCDRKDAAARSVSTATPTTPESLQQPLLTEGDVSGNVGSLGTSSLGETWERLVVRVMSARSHDFGNAVANSFYSPEMRQMAAAEHAKHVLLASNGFRTAYPHITHTKMFAQTDDIVRNVLEIADVLRQQQSQQQTQQQ